MLEYLKNYYVFMLVLIVFSFLVPKDEYKGYLQFFVSIFLIVLFLKPVLELLTLDEPTLIYDIFSDMNQQIEEFNIEGSENIYEHFFFEGERE